MSIRGLSRLYMAHRRARPLPELLALLGIAAGVALLFAVQVANRSVSGSFEQLTKGIAGRASLEIAARGPQGFSEAIFRKVERLPAVDTAAPVVERRTAVRGPNGRAALTLVGIDERLSHLKGRLARKVARRRDLDSPGLHLTEPIASAIGSVAGQSIAVEVGEREVRVPVASVVRRAEIGSLVESPVAVASLGLAQQIAGVPDRLSRILVAPARGRTAEARRELRRIAAGRLDVRPVGTESSLLREAAAADRQSSALFSVISLVVGILLAYNAMLLTLTDRRRTVASLHMLGISRRTIVCSLAFDALALGLAGSLLGLVFGDLLSRYVMHAVPDYLSAVFPIGKQRVVDVQTVILSMLGGSMAALAAASRPALTLLRLPPQEALSANEASAGGTESSRLNWGLVLGGTTLIALFVGLALLLPELTLVSMGLLILAMVMLISTLVARLLAIANRLVGRSSSAALRVAVGELTASPTRAAALATVGALALLAILAMTGPGRDMQRGLWHLQTSIYSNADIWVAPRLDENSFITQPFDQRRAVRRIRRLPQVDSVGIGRASFLDLYGRRVLVFGTSGAATQEIAPGQVIDGDFAQATRRIRGGGWVALTKTLADERELKVGDALHLPTPSGNRRFRLAATITSYVWPSGALIVNATDYGRAWQTRQVNALLVDLAPGVSPSDGRAAIRRALGRRLPLAVLTAAEGRASGAALTRQALVRINQIADMVIVAAVLALAAAMLGSVWQRRHRLWGLVSIGMGRGHVYRIAFIETVVVLFIGCLIGTGFGILGQYLVGRWLHATTAYSVIFEPAWGLALKTLVLTIVLAALALTLPLRLVFSSKRVAMSYE